MTITIEWKWLQNKTIPFQTLIIEYIETCDERLPYRTRESGLVW